MLGRSREVFDSVDCAMNRYAAEGGRRVFEPRSRLQDMELILREAVRPPRPGG